MAKNKSEATPVKDYLMNFLPEDTQRMARHRMSESDFITVYKKAEKEETNGNGTVTEQFVSLTEQYISLQAISSFEKKSVDLKILEEVVKRWCREYGINSTTVNVKEIENRVISVHFKNGEVRELYEQAMHYIKKGKRGGGEKVLGYLILEASEFGYEGEYDGVSSIVFKKQ